MTDKETTGEAARTVDLDLIWTGDVLSNLHGGLRTGASGLSSLDLTGHWQGQGGWEGFAVVEINNHGGFSEVYSGDTQVVSNIDLPAGSHLYEAWIRSTSADKTRVTTFGTVNINDFFDVQDVAALFLNTSHGIALDFGQASSGHPITALGIVEEWQFAPKWHVRTALFDGVAGDPAHPEAFMSVRFSRATGLQYAIEAERDFDGGFVKLGHWGKTERVPYLDGSARQGRFSGDYGQLSVTLLKGGKPDGTDDATGLRGWLRLGTAEAAVLPIDGYAGGGLVYTGLLRGRSHDQIGIAFASARYGTPYSAANGRPVSAETSFEATYQYEVKPGFVVQPDLQYIRHPSGETAVKDAEVIGLRLRISAEQFMSR